jgi:hypothetical protein
MNTSKTCTICKEIKLLEDFFRESKSADGRKSRCKTCHKASVTEWKKRNPEKVKEVAKESRKRNQDKLKNSRKSYNNSEKGKQQKKEWENNNKEKARLLRKKWYEDNKERLRDRRKKSAKRTYEKNKQNHSFRVSNAISSGIRQAIKVNKANRHWETLVGYTLTELMAHLERLFTPEMNWDNYGSYWHIDHIKPQSWFIYENTESEAFKTCWSLSNLQPLEASKNCSKGNRYEG